MEVGCCLSHIVVLYADEEKHCEEGRQGFAYEPSRAAWRRDGLMLSLSRPVTQR